LHAWVQEDGRLIDARLGSAASTGMFTRLIFPSQRKTSNPCHLERSERSAVAWQATRGR
jgi:hypothetical protein